ncbi:uncharacterized protein G2W53_029088 [Senna tora]|uniref:Uncharacterized protein n=1 Tax=Senna tora TaxID=362788 RepID=A0A834WFE3_9FABA|nr:uncharacterized protein G2W53_029088 [Senna tora]
MAKGAHSLLPERGEVQDRIILPPPANLSIKNLQGRMKRAQPLHRKLLTTKLGNYLARPPEDHLPSFSPQTEPADTPRCDSQQPSNSLLLRPYKNARNPTLIDAYQHPPNECLSSSELGPSPLEEPSSQCEDLHQHETGRDHLSNLGAPTKNPYILSPSEHESPLASVKKLDS